MYGMITEELFNIDAEMEVYIPNYKKIKNPWFEWSINTFVFSSIEMAQSIYNEYISIMTKKTQLILDD